MSIRYVVLGLVGEEPRHGYAIRAAFESRLGHFWELNYGQVYQTLMLLEAQGLIAGRHEQVGKRPARRVYAITPKGRASLQRWLEHPRVASAKPFRDDFYARLVFVREHDDETLRRLLKARLDACEQRLTALLDERRPPGRASNEQSARWLFTEAAILHAEAEFKAAQLCCRILTQSSETERASHVSKQSGRVRETVRS